MLRRLTKKKHVRSLHIWVEWLLGSRMGTYLSLVDYLAEVEVEVVAFGVAHRMHGQADELVYHYEAGHGRDLFPEAV